MREPTEMEMRVAAVLRGPGASCEFGEADALAISRAVIGAMKLATGEMVKALIDRVAKTTPDSMAALDIIKSWPLVYSTMIDAASPEIKE